MLLLKIDPTPGHAADFDPIEVATAPNLSDLIQLRRDRIRGTRQDADDLPSPKLARYRGPVAGASCEYRDEDLISVLGLGEEFLVFVTDDGHAPYLFRIVVEASKIDKVLTGGQVGSGELSVARFVANGVMIWLPLPRAIRSSIYETAGRLGATVLGPVERTELLPLATSLRLTLRGGDLGSRQVPNLPSVDLCPPRIGDRQLWRARRYSWSESDQLSPARRASAAVNDNDMMAARQSDAIQ